jgi:hypothetical protein
LRGLTLQGKDGEANCCASVQARLDGAAVSTVVILCPSQHLELGTLLVRPQSKNKKRVAPETLTSVAASRELRRENKSGGLNR